MKNSKEYQDAKRNAIDKAAGATHRSDIFEAGFDFAMRQPKPLFDTVNSGELRSHRGTIYEVVNFTRCEDCDLCTDGSCRLIDDDLECPFGVVMFKKVE